MDLITRFPWWMKLSGKLLLSRIPVSYAFWSRLGLFRHGSMDDPARAISTFDYYYSKAQQYAVLPDGFVSIELGPGDSVLSGLVSRAYGAQQAWLVDAGEFASTDTSGWYDTIALLRERGKSPPHIAGEKALTHLLSASGVRYLTRGTASLAEIPDASVDFIWSQVVLEHIPRDEFPALCYALRRVIKPGGIGVHSIDFRDHLGGGLNNLRFSASIWEKRWFRQSGFYTNRLRPKEIVAHFLDAGFSVEIINETRWPDIPIMRNKMAKEFQHFPDADFLTAEMEIIIKP